MRAAFALLLIGSLAGADEGKLRKAEREMERAHKLLADHDYAAAREHFETARGLAPESSGPYLGIGITSFHLDDCPAALGALQEYLRRKSTSPSPLAQEILDECQKQARPPQPPAAPQPGTLHVEALPLGAEVRIDDPDGPLTGRAPLDVTVAAGRHIIYLSYEGYRASQLTSEVGSGSVTRIQATLEILPPPGALAPPAGPPRGKLELFVGPPPVSVRLNGARMPGNGPTFGAELPSGLYHVIFEKQGHEPELRDVWVRAGDKVEQRFSFGGSTSVGHHRMVVALSVLVPLVVVGVAVGLGVGLTQPSTSSSSGREINFGTVSVP